MLRGDIVKDDSGAYAVFTEQGSSASQMTAAKVMDVIARLPDCDGQAADAISAFTQVKMKDTQNSLKFPSGMINPSYPSSEMHLGKFTDHTEFQSWIVNFRVEVCAEAKNPSLDLQWIKEIEAAKSLDDLITPKSITDKDFLDCEELDMMMAVAL